MWSFERVFVLVGAAVAFWLVLGGPHLHVLH